MWLIDVRTRTLEHFTDERQQRYAILSHTWGDDEVTFQDIQTDTAQTKEGFRKIEYTCNEALSHGISYAWVDTVCINKQSSAELSEAINSMFSYYQEAQVCYVYLSDSPEHLSAKIASEDLIDSEEDRTMEFVSDLSDCRWFTRGWTLQELLAPSDLLFYGREWMFIGDKRTLRGALKIITGIDQAALDDYISSDYQQAFSVAQKMSWAANRNTTRDEDRAYSLLGLFNVNMPLVYGERGKAFRRLQEEIIRTSSDHSIFAWHHHLDADAKYGDLLAASPDNFAQLSTVVAFDQIDTMDHPQLINQGLQLRAMIGKPTRSSNDDQTSYAILRCRYGDDFSGPLALCLYPVAGKERSDPAVFCVSEQGKLESSSHGRIALLPFGMSEQAIPTSCIILKDTAVLSNANKFLTSGHRAPPQVWVRILDPRIDWSDACQPFPQERWIGQDVFVLDSQLAETKEHIGCKMLTEDVLGHEARVLAIAFGVKYAPKHATGYMGKYGDYEIRLGVEESLWNFSPEKANTAMQMQYAQGLLAQTEWSSEPSISWGGRIAMQVQADRTTRMGQDLFMITARVSYDS